MEEIDYQFEGDVWFNSTIDLEYENPDQPLILAFVIVCSILSVLITLLNGALMIAILLKRKPRSSPKYFIVLNLSIVGLIDGAFLGPVQVLGWNEWHLPCFVMAAAETIAIAFISLDLMLITTMCIQWMTSITIPSYNTKTRFSLVLFLVVLSWLSSFLVTLSYVIPGGENIYIDQRCLFSLGRFVLLGLQVMPVPLLFILFIVLILLLVVKSRQTRGRYNQESNEKKFPFDALFSGLVILFLTTSPIFRLIENIRYSLLAIVLIMVLARSRHIFIPIIWLTMSKSIRRAVLCKEEEPEFAESLDLTGTGNNEQK